MSSKLQSHGCYHYRWQGLKKTRFFKKPNPPGFIGVFWILLGFTGLFWVFKFSVREHIMWSIYMIDFM